ncbi:MAG: hypothetical protein D6696_17250, partial [Acidobacteria bacterium]
MLLIPLLLLQASACGRPAGEEETGAAVPQEEPAAAVAPPQRLAAEDLRPVIRASGSAGAAPSRIVIEFARPVVDEAGVGQAPAAGTVVRIDPPVAGDWRFAGTSTLAFVPRTGFAPAARYEVELVALAAAGGLLEAPQPGRWRHVFETPPFDFLRLALGEVDYGRGTMTAQLAFSAAVAAAEVERRAHLELVAHDGRSIPATVRIAPGPEANVVEARIESRELRPGTRLELRLERGVPSAVAPVATRRRIHGGLNLGQGPSARILAAHPAEGANGFYLQVICDDGAVTGRRYHWDRALRTGFEVSRRCLIDDEQVRAGIRLEPPVDLSVAPAAGGFRLFGDFARGSYRLRIDAGLKTVDGGLIQRAFDADFTVPARSPQIHFAARGRYLPRRSWSSLPVRYLNLDRAVLQVRHVPPANLVYWIGKAQEAADERTSDLIAERTIPLGGEPDVETTTRLDVASLLPATTRGLIELRLVGADGRASAAARLLLTDLHLIAKRAAPPPGAPPGFGAVHVWALDMATIAPRRGVTVELVRASGKVLARCATRKDGGCTLQPAAGDVDPSPPIAIVARHGHDLTYLEFAELKTEVQEERIAGDPYRDEQPYRAALYGDRGVYRPGETAHLAAIVRDEANLAPPAGMPVALEVVDPQGQTIRSLQLQTNAAGFVASDVDLPPFARTGRYRARLEVAERAIGALPFQVEEMVPERLAVEVASGAAEYLLGEAMEVAVTARYLFGGVPAHHRLELACELRPGSFDPPQNADYHYGVWRDEDEPPPGVELGRLTGELDGDGGGTFACPAAGRGAGFPGPARLIARAAVFEAGSGRSTTGRMEVPVHPERFYLGLKSGATAVTAGGEVVVEGVVVDWRGRLVEEAPEVEIELLRLDTEWGWYFDPRLGRDSWRRYRRPVVEMRLETRPAGGRFRARLRSGADGEAFLVRASAGGARSELELAGRGGWYYWRPQESAAENTPRPGRPTWLALDAPQQVRVGERFPLQLTVPFAGRLLVTAETDRLLSSRWLEVKPGEVVTFLRLDDFAPNVYLTAFLVKDPRSDGRRAFLPDRAFGVRSLRVEPSDFVHRPVLEVPAEVRSQTPLVVGLDLGPARDREGPTYATVAVVDEGLLSLTRFASPDPAAAVFARRALGVETFETVGWTLLVPPATPSDAAGGDVAALLGRLETVKPLALWSGLVEVPASGELSLRFDLPAYRGAVRVMAVTAGRKRLGHAEARVVVRDPLVVQPTLPRFLVRGDELRVPVMVTNLSGERRRVSVRLEAESLAGEAGPPVVVAGDGERRLELADGASDTVVFGARTAWPGGGVRLRVVARAGELTSRQEAEVPILPEGPPSRIVKRLALAEGTTELAAHLEGWVPLTERTTLWVTRHPYGDVFGHLAYLVRYPYGCLEQTISATRPLLYVGELLGEIDPQLLAEGSIEERVRHGLDRLLSMQTPGGGFAYWPGGIEPTHWATAHAAHLLLDARELGYRVPEGRLDEVLGWMERTVAGRSQDGLRETYAAAAEPYMHYVLARAGRAHKQRIENLLAGLPAAPAGEALEHRFLLQAALYLAGDRRYEDRLRRPDLRPVSDQRVDGWSFYSDRRRRGLMLAILTDLFGRDKAFAPLADVVAGTLADASASFTTQELAWGVTGLGKYVEPGSGDFDPPILRAGDRVVPPQPPAAGASDRHWSLARASEYPRLSLELPRRGEGGVYLVLASEGVRQAPDWRTGGEGLRLARRYLDGSGREIDLAAGGHRLGDLVYVELSLENTTPQTVRNVALVDRLPAGWEIENPRLGRDGSAGWIDRGEIWQADHMDLRDDRLEVFGPLPPGRTVKVVYAVRAVTAGRFTIPAASAEAMYDPRLWARLPPSAVVIAGPWDAAGAAAGGGR